MHKHDQKSCRQVHEREIIWVNLLNQYCRTNSYSFVYFFRVFFKAGPDRTGQGRVGIHWAELDRAEMGKLVQCSAGQGSTRQGREGKEGMGKSGQVIVH